MMRFLTVFFFLAVNPLFAMLVGNPAAPTLQTCSILNAKPSWYSFRIGYLDDWIYHQEHLDIERTVTKIDLSTYAGLLTLNFIDRFDIYGLVGSSRMQIEEEIYTKRALGWGVGGKWILFKWPHFSIGVDVKYFETNQKPRFFIVENLPFNIISNFRLQYQEMQAAFGMCYHVPFFAPYVNLTYIQTRIEPKPPIVLVRFPDEHAIADISIKSLDNQDHWGIALGLSLIDQARMTLSFEWRTINQNAIDWNFEIRF